MSFHSSLAEREQDYKALNRDSGNELSEWNVNPRIGFISGTRALVLFSPDCVELFNIDTALSYKFII